MLRGILLGIAPSFVFVLGRVSDVSFLAFRFHADYISGLSPAAEMRARIGLPRHDTFAIRRRLIRSHRWRGVL
jgi:hypothetical protein